MAEESGLVSGTQDDVGCESVTSFTANAWRFLNLLKKPTAESGFGKPSLTLMSL
jgi:hypothetical protein